jgi:hypothetical protein
MNQRCSIDKNGQEWCTEIEDIDTITSKQRIYDALVEYFDHPILTKSDTMKGIYSIYKVGVPCGYGQTYRYLVAYVPEDGEPMYTQQFLSNLSWDCFQTQTTHKDEKVGIHSYDRKKVPLLENTGIQVIENGRKEDRTIYYSKDKMVPLKIELFPKNKKLKSKYDYAEEGTLRIALDTFQTSLTFL